MSDLQIILHLSRTLADSGFNWTVRVASMCRGHHVVLRTRSDVAHYALVDGAKACRQIIWC